MATTKRDFLTLLDLSSEELREVMDIAKTVKAEYKEGKVNKTLKNQTLLMIFEKNSTRTRISFETGMTQLGGHSIYLNSSTSHIGSGAECLEDTARVVSRMVDQIMIRTFGHDIVEKLAKESRVPVINALTDLYHPCQLLADMLTYEEHRGSIQGKTVTWVGDGNNMTHSFINAAIRFDFKLVLCIPEGYDCKESIVKNAGDRVTIERDPKKAVVGADVVVTDTWASMGQEDETAEREKVFAPLQVNADLMKLAKEDSLFFHCLPAHRNSEVTDEVIDGPQSIVYYEAENRLHAQKALLLWLNKFNVNRLAK
eukprot:TRINITY_DN13002_c0_g1_i1.p1 TRINITY_DN13002_c0_g1~~TRINITY_DN13002_c0_g1_i1.p1  ORF type:complete len:322 (-),score=92.84 TRINITY_DN13002_c0_g1_i1:213-1148(-)